ncbi:hypothetical protein Bbelb_240520 [Branchiostoma belcheri]|nr:hypothetical protein Bbelb_240520 [Branchiostoma belcheri]
MTLTGRNQENLQAPAKACVEAGTPEDKGLVAPTFGSSCIERRVFLGGYDINKIQHGVFRIALGPGPPGPPACGRRAIRPAIQVVTGDICDDELRKNLVDQTAQKFSRIDVLVNNAGIFTFGSIETTDMAVYDKMMDVNVRSAVRLTQLCVPHLTKTTGAVVNVSSINGVRSMSGCLAYSISKVALDQFTRCVALELASKQIRVNSVNPGVIPTDIFKRGGMTDEEIVQLMEHCKSTHALGRVTEVSEVAKTIAFLASSDASFITGAQVPVYGGKHAIVGHVSEFAKTIAFLASSDASFITGAQVPVDRGKHTVCPP